MSDVPVSGAPGAGDRERASDIGEVLTELSLVASAPSRYSAEQIRNACGCAVALLRRLAAAPAPDRETHRRDLEDILDCLANMAPDDPDHTPDDIAGLAETVRRKLRVLASGRAGEDGR